MGLPAKNSNTLVLVFLNGVKQSRDGDYEIEGRYVRFAYRIKRGDKFSAVVLSSDDPIEFETELPYNYEADVWFDPSDPHDPKVKQIEPPPPTVTQL
jgi:hypothetical protein